MQADAVDTARWQARGEVDRARRGPACRATPSRAGADRSGPQRTRRCFPLRLRGPGASTQFPPTLTPPGPCVRNQARSTLQARSRRAPLMVSRAHGGGFSLYATVRIEGADLAGRERLLRY